MNISANEFERRIMSRIKKMVHDSGTTVTMRYSLLWAHDSHGRRVNLARLATFADGDFWHDVIGCNNHASRDYGTIGLLEGGFVPRCGFAD